MIHLLIRLAVTWAAVFTLATGSLLTLQVSGVDWPLPVRVLVMSLVLVPLMMLVIGPYAARLATRLTHSDG